MDRLQEVQQAFAEKYGTPPQHIVRAPGRVNLIGEHTDYNEGWVLPMAIDLEVLIAARPRTDHRVHLIALDRGGEQAEFSLDDIRVERPNAWDNYVRGIAAELESQDLPFPGMDAVITGNIPIGSGLSSSAALLIAAAVMFETLGGFTIDRVQMARLGQKAENEYCGVQSGIMDQFTVALARAGHALLIDCRDLTYRDVPLPKGGSIVVVDSTKRRDLSNSAYNTRRAECEEAVRLISRKLNKPVAALRDVTMQDLDQVSAELPENLAKRARHIVAEDERVIQAVAAAERDDLATLGRLMNESHESLRELYEVSSPELDALVEIARQQPGVLGARLTGAGFGGCTVNLVHDSAARSVGRAIVREYLARTGVKAPVLLVSAASGAGRVL